MIDAQTQIEKLFEKVRTEIAATQNNPTPDQVDNLFVDVLADVLNEVDLSNGTTDPLKQAAWRLSQGLEDIESQIDDAINDSQQAAEDLIEARDEVIRSADWKDKLNAKGFNFG